MKPQSLWLGMLAVFWAVVATPPVAAQVPTATPEFTAALTIVRQRAAAGDPVAQYELATAYFDGRIIQYGRVAALQWFRRAAEAGYAPAQFRLARLLTWEQATEQRQWVERAAAQNYAPALLWGIGLLGDEFADDKPPADAARDMPLVLRAAELGEATAQAAAAKAYLLGRYGLARDAGKALYWKQRSQYYLGDLPANFATARADPAAIAAQSALIARDVALARAGAERGEAAAQFELALLTVAGRGVPRDVAAGRALAVRAAEQGFVPAGQFLLFMASGMARGFALDVPELVRWGAMVKARGFDHNLGDLEKRFPSAGATAPFLFARAATVEGSVPTALAGAEPVRKPVTLEPRVALVIGNGGYTGALGRLSNAVADAQLMANALRQAGFAVELVTDADQRTMKEAIRRLGERMRTAGATGTGLFYYAGHGAQSEGINYLAPIGAPLATEGDLELDAISADGVLAHMDRSGARTSIVILDACRNMPLARKTRDGTRGLARMERGRGAFIAYAATPGETASDGGGGNSPFTRALAAEVTRPGQSIDIAFRRVRAAVVEATAGRQTPWDSSSLVTDFAFTP